MCIECSYPLRLPFHTNKMVRAIWRVFFGFDAVYKVAHKFSFKTLSHLCFETITMERIAVVRQPNVQ